MRFTYSWLHFPSGQGGDHTKTFNSLYDLLQTINKWNRESREQSSGYVYWTNAISVQPQGAIPPEELDKISASARIAWRALKRLYQEIEEEERARAGRA